MLMKLFGLFGDWTVAGNLQDQRPGERPVEIRECIVSKTASIIQCSGWLLASHVVNPTTLPPAVGVHAGTNVAKVS
jgi:hypothetical protein